MDSGNLFSDVWPKSPPVACFYYLLVFPTIPKDGLLSDVYLSYGAFVPNNGFDWPWLPLKSEAPVCGFASEGFDSVGFLS